MSRIGQLSCGCVIHYSAIINPGGEPMVSVIFDRFIPACHDHSPERRATHYHQGEIPFAPDSATSRAAARAMKKRLGRAEMKVIGAFVLARERGLTVEECAEQADLGRLTAAARITTLCARGYLSKTGEQRALRSGCSGHVWVISSPEKLAQVQAIEGSDLVGSFEHAAAVRS